MKKLFCIMCVVFSSSLAWAQPKDQAGGFEYPTTEKLRKDGYEFVSIVAGLGGLAMVLKKGQVIYLCQLQSYSYTTTKEEFLQGERCVKII
jgi:hypothetical protein